MSSWSPAYAESTALDAQPRKVGSGPVQFSTSCALEVPRPIIWDANGYYAELGVSPYATRRELREAYQALDGHSSVRLTYILRQLLDPETRRAYDRTPLGHRYIDQYVEREMRRASALQVSKDRMRRWRETGRSEPIEMVDWEDDPRVRSGVSHPPETLGASPSEQRQPWGWSYYLWRTNLADEERLRRWQCLVVQALWTEGYEVQMSVGLARLEEPPVQVRPFDGHLVAFLDARENPSEAAAERVVASLTTHNRER